MYPHWKPDFPVEFTVETEIGRLVEHQQTEGRTIPEPTNDNLLIATWNLTNFGVQEREDDHITLMAEIIRPFDVVAFQEVADNIKHLNKLKEKLGANWEVIYTDIAGNYERLGYFYKSNRLQPTGLAAELAMRGYERAYIVIEGIDPEETPFTGFNRNPYIVGFKADTFEFSLVNVHLYWSNMALRRLETKALAKWAEKRVTKSGPPNNDIVLIGDFNMPHPMSGDQIFDELREYGLQIPKHTTDLVGTNLAGDKHYDEIAFFPSRTSEDFTSRMGVFDFDNAVFRDFWDSLNHDTQARFFQYVRYYLADHRPLWAEFRRSTQ